MTRALLVAALSAMAMVTSPAEAQKKSCRVDSTAAWYRKQHAWFDDAKQGWSNDTLRARLMRAAGITDAPSMTMQFGWEMQETRPVRDSAITVALRLLAATRGSIWPTRSVVGAAGVRAVWLIAEGDTSLARAALKRMMEAGPDESNAPDVATLEDRMRLLWGRKQLYATQFRTVGGKVELLPTEDLAHVDLRREDAGLPPFAVSACLAGYKR